jgi:RNA polymerase sigma-70 factor (ECF subfamily)
MPDSETVLLLRRWHAGDRGALDLLLERDLAWVRERVRRRLGPLLRAKAQTDDFVQDAVVEVLRYAPRFEVADRSQFRALLARIVENVLRDEHDRFSAKRRAIRRELPFPAGEEDRGPADDSSLRPSRLAEREEWESCIRFALALLDQEDREVVLLREWDGRAFREIGEALGVSEDAARMRFHRGVARLAGQVQRLRGGKISDLPLPEEPRHAGG